MSFETSFQHLLKWEGGYGDDAKDAGGPTNLGVIQEEYDRYRDRKERPRQSVRYISRTEAEEIYRIEYWDATRCDELNPGLANCLFDADVNSGDSRGVQWLQEAINAVHKSDVVVVDKKCGPLTVAAANGLSAPQLIDVMLNLRLAFMHVAKNSKTGESLWPTFGRGWQKRIDGVRQESHALCGVTADLPPLISAPATTPSPEKSMTDLSPILNLAKVIAPVLAPALEKSNPLFGIAISLLSDALQTTPEALPSTVGSVLQTAPAGVATALQTAENAFKAHIAAAVALAPSASVAVVSAASPAATPAPVAPSSTENIYVDSVASTVKYVLGVVAVAIMVHLGLSVDLANGIAANIIPVVWTGMAGAMTAGVGWLLHRSITGSNAATAQFTKQA